ncbi:MAG TPA: tetratricopeptide repeat protein [Egibacteraceae bacterium]|nr:tetratricopeptide repeat protein [Egibacteraceae bacterium]
MSGRAAAWAEFLLGDIADLRGQYADADQRYDRSEAGARAASEWGLAALTAYRRGRVASAQGRFTAAEEHFNRCVQTCEERAVAEGWAGSLLSLAWMARLRDAPPDSVRTGLERALERAQETGDAQIQSAAHRQLGFLAWDRFRDRADAQHHYDAAHAISTERQEAKELGAIEGELGYLASEWGDLDAAEEHSWRSIEIARRIGDAHLLASAYWNLGRALQRRGDLDGAEHWHGRSRDQQQLLGNPTGEAVAELSLAQVRRLQGRAEEARESLVAAQRLVEAHGFGELRDDLAQEAQAQGLGREAGPESHPD